MGYWNSRGLRGNSFEELINYTNEIYKKNNLALIEKIPTPIKPVELDNKNHTISLAYFEKKSTVDYIGVVQGIAICFDAKETAKKSLPLQNIHEHQIEFMDRFEKQQGISFILVHFLFNDTYFYLPFKNLKEAWENLRYGRKSIPYEKFEHQIFLSSNYFLNYLDIINKIIGT
jgi:Penicillin-binding protein-related factor A, putative recombinase